MRSLDIDFIRSQFPAFSESSLAGQAFFENAGGSYTCKHVVDRLHRFYRERKVQPYAPYDASRLGGEEMDEARTRLAGLMNIHSDELSFGPSTSQNTYVLAQAFGQMLSSGDAIIVTDQDHEANTGVWRRLADKGIEVREWHVDAESGQLDLATLATILDENVKLVCFPHCSNIVGQENPVADIARMAHDVGAVTCTDGVSMAPHGLPDMRALGTDIYLFSSYKTYGPHQGIMFIARDLADRLPNQAHFFNSDVRYKRFTPAGPDHAQIAACAGMADYIDAVHDHHFTPNEDAAARGRAVRQLQRDYEDLILTPLLDYLRSRNDIRIMGADKVGQRVPTVAIHADKPATELAETLANHGVMAGGGDFYAVRLIEAMGVAADPGVLRLSFVHYTHADEVQKLITALDATL
ncbi:MAG: aminotransferase class V-fold PLP-dependent enzyme [Candidatus Puniceispirillum sp.]|uniref:aminotransferase class V-fold PLP-dependent enzyme n=3 Tax=Candidatus Puniceispirillum TaxID=767891 RepID=UPI002A73D3CB|nr:aminotransferase class V-fold PLP-dependent enzyme [Candidatus Puniceispirillum sp.]MBT6566149.1 aminotransferase class V-fold PLP-dependent enzyme [Candidatus Puniceispirillum sp.]